VQIKITLNMKIYINKLKENWIVDRFRREFLNHQKESVTNFVSNSDVIWIIAPWVWKKIPKRHLKNKKVLCTYHHFDFSNFDKENFNTLDKFVDEYHVISKKTELDLKKLTNKKITTIPFWIDEKQFFYIENKEDLREHFGFSKNEFLLGSFQRDTEGHDLKSPKLVKGPDRFLEIAKRIYKKNPNLIVVLSGKRRQYLIENFENFGIPYKYFEMVNLENMNKLYNILDLYIVSSRIEGGPQAILECAISRTPIISTDVGIAREILHPSSIFEKTYYDNALPNINHAFKNSLKFKKEYLMNNYKEMFINIT